MAAVASAHMDVRPSGGDMPGLPRPRLCLVRIDPVDADLRADAAQFDAAEDARHLVVAIGMVGMQQQDRAGEVDHAEILVLVDDARAEHVPAEGRHRRQFRHQQVEPEAARQGAAEFVRRHPRLADTFLHHAPVPLNSTGNVDASPLACKGPDPIMTS